jgi:sialate O-acetylesterase
MLVRAALILFFVFVWHRSVSQIRLPRLISDNAILQRDTRVPIFGWSSPLEAIELQFDGKRFTTKASEIGEWHIDLPPQKAGGPYDLELIGKNKIVLHNIVFGDVWVCSGQSNMELTMERVKYKIPASNCFWC